MSIEGASVGRDPQFELSLAMELKKVLGDDVDVEMLTLMSSLSPDVITQMIDELAEKLKNIPKEHSEAMRGMVIDGFKETLRSKASK